MARRILVVDDEPTIAKGLKYGLEQDGYEVEIGVDGLDAVERFFAGKFDLVLLDVMLPGIDGIQVCQQIREKSDVPIIMLTAKGEDMDKILGLEYGADDYMTKPFNFLEVKARIKSIFRRTQMMSKDSDTQIIRIRDMEINLNNRSVVIGDREVNLTAKEFDLLQLFASNRGKVFSREDLLSTIWKYDKRNYLGDLRTVDVHIRRLREKVEKNPAQPEFIFTKWGVGYYFTDKD
ncbi:MAG: response regulator transcription factor [Clostridia bacterium]|nr:response regulator transcription factor [Clostridia bacterium]